LAGADSRRTSGPQSPRRRCRSGPLVVLRAFLLALMDQPIKLAQAYLLIFEQTAQRIELHRVMLAQDFGRASELKRICWNANRAR
jgi:hypothetical protein